MNIKNLLSACVVAILAITGFNALAGNINADAARSIANSYLKLHSASQGTLKAPASADIHLVHAEASSVDSRAKVYYAFNIQGGGFIIVAGEDRAPQVLGYSDSGHLSMDKLPDGFKALMRGYKEQIEYLQAHPDYNVAPAIRATVTTGVDPLIKTNWGQEMPYYLQCPIYQGEYCVVGCVATAMAQVMYYWKYPSLCPGLNSYYCYDIGQNIEELPETTFDYNKMLPSYCHWDWDLGQLVQDTYTDAQAQEVAKLSRYCGQAVKMGYSPEGSGAYTSNQLSAMKNFGYNSDARDEMRDGWWSSSYSTAEWEAMIREELDKRQPILYAASDPAAGGHAFICDGYNTDGLFHFNFGWYGTCDGWYVSTALNMTHRDGDYLRFNSNHEMLLDVVPPTYCLVSADGIEASSDLQFLGEAFDIQATNVNILTTNSSMNLMFSLNNATGMRKATSQPVKITVADYEQGSTILSPLTLPASLPAGSYTLEFCYYGQSPRSSVAIPCESGYLNVVGHVAKYNAPFTIDDVTTTIDALLTGSHANLTISDVTDIIDVLLASN